MSLNHSQKNYIKKYIKQKSVNLIASELHVSEGIILGYLKEQWNQEKYRKFLSKQSTHAKENFTITFHLKSWLLNNSIFLLILTALVFIVYVNSFNNAFVSDDNGIVINAPLWDSFEAVFYQPLLFIRPLLYFIVYKTVGLNPIFFRIINIFFHLGSMYFVYLTLHLISKKTTLAFFAAALFAIHPILIESVTWISGGVYSQYGFFFLLSFTTYILGRNNLKYFVVSIISYSLALISSEKAVSLFPLFFIFELCFGSLRKNWKKPIIYFFITLLFLVMFFTSSRVTERIVGLESDSAYSKQGYDNPFQQIPIAITLYVQYVIFPNDLTIYHSEMSFSFVEYMIRFTTFLFFIVLSIFAYKRNKQIFFWICFFIFPLLPTLTPLRLSWIVAERYVYLGTVGLFAIVAIALERLTQIKKIKQYVYIVFFIVLLLLSIRTIVRNIDWKNEDNLWIATGKTSPSSPNTHNNLGDVYGRHGDHQNAAKEFKRAIELKPDYADAYHNLANAYVSLNKLKDAEENYKKAASINPALWQSYQRLSALYYEQGKFTEALEYAQKAIAINTQDINLHINESVIQLAVGNKKKALEILQKILVIDPQNQRAQQVLIEVQKIK